MSMIIYGPCACGKTYQAENLRRFFKMDEVVDDGSDPYPLTVPQVNEFLNGRILFLTNILPTDKEYSKHIYDGKRRVLSFQTAMRLMQGE